MKKKPTSTNSIENIFNSAGIEQNLNYWTPGDLPALTYKKMRNLKLLSSFLLIAGILSMASCRKPYSQSPADPQESPGTTFFLANALASSSIGTLRVVTLAGDGTPGYLDGTTVASQFKQPSGVAMDASGNVYVADAQNHRIRKITSAGVVSTLAGNGTPGTATGAGTAAQFNNPSGVAVDAAGNVYVADKSNHAIRKISPAGEVTNFAGTPNPMGQSSTDGPASTARFNNPAGVAIDATGNLYVADAGNHKIRKITVSGTTVSVSTFAGNGTPGTGEGFPSFAQFNTPSGVAVNASGTEVYVADSGNNKIRKIVSSNVSTLAGGGGPMLKIPGFLDATGTAALFNGPTGVTVDSSGNVWVADKLNHAIRQVTATGVVTTLAGNGTAAFVDSLPSEARFSFPAGIAIDAAGNLFIGDGGNNRIREIGFVVLVSTLAGSGIQGEVDGPSNTAQFYYPNGITIDAIGNTYVTDGYTEIRKITLAGQVTTPAGSSQGGYADGTGIFAKFTFPEGLAADAAGNIYVADSWNNRIRKVTPAGVVTTFAGNGDVSTWGNAGGGYVDGPANQAKFFRPIGIAIDAAGNIYVGDSGNKRLRKITPDGMVSTLAGSGVFGFADGTASIAQFASLNRLAIDPSGNVYVSDTYNKRIRKVTPDGMVSTLAGSGVSGFKDGPGSTALFVGPSGIAIDGSQNIYVTDYNRIRKISPAGVVSTIAGNGTAGFKEGLGSVAQFNGANDIAISPSGALYVTDYYNNRIRKIQ